MRFIIFSLARCGSTTLMNALNCYPDVRCALEPFTPANLGTPYGHITEAAALDKALTELWRDYNGIKHVWHPAGWPFKGAVELNRRLLRHENAQIIFLDRRNSLQRVISTEISWQTSVWGRYTEEQRQRVRRFDFKPVSLVKIERQLGEMAAGLDEMRSTLHAAAVNYFELWYEDLFGGDVYLAERLKLMDRLRAFVGAAPVGDVRIDFAVANVLNPETSKLNLIETYRRIPNIDEVERRFGSDEAGWLFKESSDHAMLSGGGI